jgi:hypothetical protein
MWESPTLVQDKWKDLFQPLRSLFPQEWLTALRSSPLGLTNAIIYLALLGILFALYLTVLRLAFKPGTFRFRDAGPAFRCIFLVTLAVSVLLFFSVGTFSTDLYSYIWYGRIFALYGDNPFVSYPAQYAWVDAQGWLQWVYWKHTPSVYGPAWLLLAGGIAQIASALDGDIVTHLLGHKLLASCAHLANIVLIWYIAPHVIGRFWRMPEGLGVRARRDWQTATRIGVTIMYAWNPLMIVEFVLSGHNDIFAVTAVLGAVWLHLSGRWRLAVLALAGAAMFKITSLLLLPPYICVLFWEGMAQSQSHRLAKGLWRAGQASAITVITVIVGYGPFAQDAPIMQALSGGPPAQYFIHSIGALLRYKLAEGISNLADMLRWHPAPFWSVEQVGERLEWPARWGLLSITGVVALLHMWRARSFPLTLYAWGWMTFTYLTLGSVWFWPWYVAFLIVPVALVGPGRLWNATQILCASSLALYACFPVVAAPFQELPGWSGLVIMAPPLLYLLGAYVHDRLANRVPRTSRTNRRSDGQPEQPVAVPGSSAA